MSPDVLPSLRFDSSRIAAAERHARWQAMLGGVCSVAPQEGRSHADCAARADVWNLGGMIAVDLRLNAQSHARTLRHVRADQMDHYRLALKLRGRQTCDLGDRLHTMAPGDLLLVDQARAECSHFHGDAGHNLVFYFPREPLDELLPRPMDLHGVALRGGTAALLADHLCALVRHLPRLGADNAAALTTATLHLLAAGLGGDAQARERARPAIDSGLLRQACRHIELHLMEAELSSGSIAAFFRISRATLYRLFEPLGGVAGYIKERRLLHIHAALTAAGPPPRIQRLADEHGFKSVSHLSREFRALFGYTPSQAREQRLAPMLPPTQARDGPVAFHAWMRSMHA